MRSEFRVVILHEVVDRVVSVSTSKAWQNERAVLVHIPRHAT